MAPRIVRPRRDSALLPLTLVATAASGVGGWFLGVKVFEPARAMAPEEPAGPAGSAAPDAPAPVDASAPARPATPDASVAPSVPVRVNPGAASGCGDGEEMSIAGPSCDQPVGLEPALRARLTEVLGRCPSAASAAADPSRVLSLGLRVDFPRRRVVSLLGRSSTVPDKVSYVPCVNAGLGALDEVWRIAHGHARYQYFFAARFGPLRGPAPTTPTTPTTPAAAPTPATPAPATPAPTTPVPVVDAGAASAPDPSLPSEADMLRMRVIDRATVTWTTAIVRETPRSGPVAARLPQGTALEIVDRRGSWYGVRWDRTHAGWVYGEAIGQARP